MSTGSPTPFVKCGHHVIICLLHRERGRGLSVLGVILCMIVCVDHEQCSVLPSAVGNVFCSGV